jgi:hypothetical protein
MPVKAGISVGNVHSMLHKDFTFALPLTSLGPKNANSWSNSALSSIMFKASTKFLGTVTAKLLSCFHD